MNYVKRRFAIGCVTLGLMAMMMSSSVFAAGGTQYGYNNLKLSWVTTSTSASATLKADRKSDMWISVEGQVKLEGKYIGSFSKIERANDSNTVTVRAQRKLGTIVNGYADAYRYNDSQGLNCRII